MKNLHILKTKKPSRLRYYNNSEYILSKGNLLWADSKNIYITSNEEIKEGDWCVDAEDNTTFKVKEKGHSGLLRSSADSFVEASCKKIILTTDQDLIKDGVQSIDDEFLEWFVKNPSCEGVEVKLENYYASGALQPNLWQHKIIIPKEELTISDEAKQRAKNYMSLKGALEPKQETLEEANWKVLGTKKDTFYNGAKWQAERMYSEEEVFNLLCKIPNYFKMTIAQQPEAIKDWFEQFKKK